MARHSLGRILHHDPRSLAFLVKPAGAIASASWTRHIPILDQGQLGSCTGNAGTGLLGTDGLWQSLTSVLQAKLDESFAVQLYSDATKVDNDPATYPPTDSGSSGLAIAKVLKARGLTSGYQHITSLPAAHTAIQAGPFITGINWYEGMFDSSSEGIVTISGALAGGHEIEVVGYDAARGLWRFANSWGTGWADHGYGYFSDATYARLLSEDGDATTFVPVTSPAPQPQPTPATALAAAEAVLDPWAACSHVGANAKAAAAWRTFRATV